jgi:hypothetical protein
MSTNMPPISTSPQNGSQPFLRETKYNREDRCLDMYFDGQYVGSAKTSQAAEDYLNSLVYDRLSYNAERLAMIGVRP